MAFKKHYKLVPFLSNPRTIFGVWILISIIFAVQGLVSFRYNNYLIFKFSFPHLFNELPLYIKYPTEYGDSSHYGPIFSILIAPFYYLPDFIGLPLWDILNAIVLWYAIQVLPLNRKNKIFIGWLAVPGLIASALSEQFNPMAGALIIFSYVFIQRENEGTSAFFIVLGTAIKLYGIVGLVFFFFTRKKKKFIGYLLLWSAILFMLPMLFSSPAYIIHAYVGWFRALVTKNSVNMSLLNMQDVSVMGITRRIFLNPQIPNLPFWIVGMILFFSMFLHKNRFQKIGFQLLVLSVVLITPVLFSTSAEVVTYIISITGAGIWFIQSRNTWWRNFVFTLLLFVLIFPLWTMLPASIRDHHPFIYSLKAIPFTLIWVGLLYNIHFRRKQLSLHY